MVETKTIELRRYNPAAAGSLVFNQIWRLRTGNEAISSDITQAFLVVIEDGRKKLELSLGNGLTWDAAEKSIHVQVTNEQVSFIRADTSLEYSFYVVWQHGDVQTIREAEIKRTAKMYQRLNALKYEGTRPASKAAQSEHELQAIEDGLFVFYETKDERARREALAVMARYGFQPS